MSIANRYMRIYHQLGFDSYTEYLSSDHWRKLREEYWESGLPHSCVICQKPFDLVLHHRGYENLGNERVGYDVVLVCQRCHTLIHFNGKEKTPLIRRHLLRREEYLKRKRQSIFWKLYTIRPSEVIEQLWWFFTGRRYRRPYINWWDH